VHEMLSESTCSLVFILTTIVRAQTGIETRVT
jgi:hypothetical protein